MPGSRIVSGVMRECWRLRLSPKSFYLQTSLPGLKVLHGLILMYFHPATAGYSQRRIIYPLAYATSLKPVHQSTNRFNTIKE